MAKGVQFRGIPAIMECFDNMNLSAWSLTYDKNIVCKYPSKQTSSTPDGSLAESKAQLANILRGLQSGESYAVYTLHLYESIPKAGIKPSTEPDYSYNFTLFARSEYEGFNERMPSVVAMNEAKAATQKIIELEAKIEALQNDDRETDAPSGIDGFLGALVTDERFKNKIQDFMFAFADKIFSGSPGQQKADVFPMPQVREPAKVGAVSDDSPVLIDQQQHEKLQQAINVLIRIDANLGDNLLKLADKARINPKKYESLVNMLNLL